MQDPIDSSLTFSNFLELFTHSDFKFSFLNTIIIAVCSVSIEIGFGLAMALFLSYKSNFIKYLRPLFILPLAIPTVVVGVMMSYLFSSSGWINRILIDLSLISKPIIWMDGGSKSLFMIIIADTWKVTPLVMLILLSGLQSIDKDLYNAAKVDGAGGFKMFLNITLPLLLPSITTAVIIRGIDAFRIFALVLILMGQNLKVLGTYSYLEYMDYQNIHLSSASSVILFILILISVIFYLKSIGKKGLIAY